MPVVHHDARSAGLHRPTSGRISELDAATVTQARVAGREPVPALELVLAELPETRLTSSSSRSAVVAGLDLLKTAAAWHRVCLGSFSEARLDRARARPGRGL